MALSCASSLAFWPLSMAGSLVEGSQRATCRQGDVSADQGIKAANVGRWADLLLRAGDSPAPILLLCTRPLPAPRRELTHLERPQLLKECPEVMVYYCVSMYYCVVELIVKFAVFKCFSMYYGMDVRSCLV